MSHNDGHTYIPQVGKIMAKTYKGLLFYILRGVQAVMIGSKSSIKHLFSDASTRNM